MDWQEALDIEFQNLLDGPPMTINEVRLRLDIFVLDNECMFVDEEYEAEMVIREFIESNY